MKRRNFITALLCSVCMMATSLIGAVPVMADAVKVVTLGADLTEDQMNTMLRYFKTDASQAQIMYITNQDEREHLSSYVPLEQIGTRTVSCAYVKPTTSGGIKVRTANLNWVTCNMIATTLSTSGVANCEVVAACPFEVSGTGALTGIIMAYETASGEKLDETKKELATQEMVVTGNLAEEVGQNDATSVVNEAKMQILENGVQNADEIYNIVYNIAQQNNVAMSNEQFSTIVSLLTEIAKQHYDYEAMKETLQTVEDNVNGVEEIPEIVIEEDTEYYEENGESIVADLDESILGEAVIADSTEDPTLAEQTNKESEVADVLDSSDEVFIPQAEFDETASEWVEEEAWVEETPVEEAPAEEEVWVEETPVEEVPAEEVWVEETPVEEVPAEEVPVAEDELNTDSLSEDAKALFARAQKFCSGEFENDAAALLETMGEGVYAAVALDAETGAKVAKEVLKDYLQILKDGTASYVPTDMDVYMTTELNMIDGQLRKLFGLEYDETMTEDVLINYTAEEKMALYDDTIRFFESLYGESIKVYEEVVDASEIPAEEIAMEEIPVEEVPAA